jgi:hypothetical protein
MMTVIGTQEETREKAIQKITACHETTQTGYRRCNVSHLREHDERVYKALLP